MRTLCLSLMLASMPASADTVPPPAPFDAIARVARSDDGSAVFSFDAKGCTIQIANTGLKLAIPLRKVTWSMTKETDGSGDAVVTARCPGKANCVSGLMESHTTDLPHKVWDDPIGFPRYSFRLRTIAREARKHFTALKRFTTNCTPPPPQTR